MTREILDQWQFVWAAYAIGAARKMRPEHSTLPDDAIIYCSFGDAS